MKRKILPIILLSLFALNVFSLTLSNSSNFRAYDPSTAAAGDPVLNLVIIWHQHQPSYKDPETGIYEQPWVFMHGTNSYPYMADVLNDYPDINVTINLTPSMLQQLMDYVNRDAFDRRLELYKMDESAMSFENKSVVMQYFFDINSQFRQEGSRYWELTEKKNSFDTLEQRVNAFTDQDFLDLKVLFLLHWINPRYLEDGVFPILLANDVAGNHYSTKDKNDVLDRAYWVIDQVVSLHDQIQNEGRLEIITTPFYHPILPLLINTSNAREVDQGVSNLPLPKQNTLWEEDAVAQIEKGYNYTRDLFGEAPKGMWPSEEAVSDEIIPLVNQTGINWFVTDYTVLKNSLGVTSLTPEQWFKPYRVEKDGKTSVAFFRHQKLSDDFGFNYGGLDPDAAVADMISQLKDIQESWTGEDDPVFTVALDGENAWENYQYDLDSDGKTDYTGNLFREKMYAALTNAQNEGWLRTITPSQYLEEHPAETLDSLDLATGSWAGNLNVWIGEEDENWAWDQLITTRNDLVQYMTDNLLSKADLPEAWEALYAAEGSDWFWWYGSDKDSGHDEIFDWQFKTILRGVYKAIGWTDSDIIASYPMLFLKQKPIIAAAIQAKQEPVIDGIISSETEWSNAAHLQNALMNDTSKVISDLYLGVDEVIDDIHLAFNLTEKYALSKSPELSFGIYFSNPNLNNGSLFPRYADTSDIGSIVGFLMSTEVRVDLGSPTSATVYYADEMGNWVLSEDSVSSLGINNIVEITIPLEILKVEKGQQILLNIIPTNTSSLENLEQAPVDGPWSLNIPIGGVDMNEVFSMADPAYDEHGIYPSSPEMHPNYDLEETGLMDILRFRVGYRDDTVYFEFKFRALFNPWNGPGGYSHPLMHVYIDNIPNHGKTEGHQNGHFNIQEEYAWDAMVKADGWEQYLLYSNDTQIGPGSSLGTFADTVDKIIVITCPIELIGTPTEDWAYTVVVGSQDYQAFREFFEQPQEWKFGGGDDGAYDPNIVDMLVPEGADQEAILTDYDVNEGRYCTVPAVGPKIGPISADDEPPIVSITSSTSENETINLPSGASEIIYTLTWNASDNIGIDYFEIFVDSQFLIELNSSFTEYNITLTEGTHEIVINVYDEAGNYGSDQLTIFVEVEVKRGIPGYPLISMTILTMSVFLILIRKKNT